ncbi:MAG: hypothetical protein KDC85_15590, partial [Saprospiraceae bacterium]|nr:hypothetical protein [Saprospiraceae bacterium]
VVHIGVQPLRVEGVPLIGQGFPIEGVIIDGAVGRKAEPLRDRVRFGFAGGRIWTGRSCSREFSGKEHSQNKQR